MNAGVRSIRTAEAALDWVIADPAQSLPANVAGDFFVDARCIDCEACRWIAPGVFGEGDGFAFVRAQPSRRAAHRALMALVACPVGAIGTRAKHDCRSEEHTSALQSLMRISYAGSLLKKTNQLH